MRVSSLQQQRRTTTTAPRAPSSLSFVSCWWLLLAAACSNTCSAFVVTPPPTLSSSSFAPTRVVAAVGKPFLSLPLSMQQKQRTRRLHVLGVETEGKESSAASLDTTTTTTGLSNGTAVVNGAAATAATSTMALQDALDESMDEAAYNYRSAIYRTLGWVSAAVAFGGALWLAVGPETGQEFFAGYLVEQSLSVDNLFVFLLLFEYFKIPMMYQDKILNWGIYGAIVMRGVMISLGATALENYHEVLLVFAAILVYSSAKFFLSGDEEEEDEDPGDNSIVQFSRNLLPSVNYFDEDRFFTVVDGLKKATPMFICMVAVEISDVVFAVDSIPAVFGVTENPLVVFSSNLFAIMGLRSLYTILSQAATDLKYLEPAVAVVLGFIGSKMIAEFFGFVVPTAVALGVVATFLGSGIALSVWEKEQTAALEAESSAKSE